MTEDLSTTTERPAGAGQVREGRTAADLDSVQASAAPSGGDSATGSADVAKLDDVEEAMRDVVDPELGINVVDLGLVY
ncbi:MAG: iron-sulfur cluster assembly protein, partial [Sciscionella sp.]